MRGREGRERLGGGGTGEEEEKRGGVRAAGQAERGVFGYYLRKIGRERCWSVGVSGATTGRFLEGEEQCEQEDYHCQLGWSMDEGGLQ